MKVHSSCHNRDGRSHSTIQSERPSKKYQSQSRPFSQPVWKPRKKTQHETRITHASERASALALISDPKSTGLLGSLPVMSDSLPDESLSSSAANWLRPTTSLTASWASLSPDANLSASTFFSWSCEFLTKSFRKKIVGCGLGGCICGWASKALFCFWFRLFLSGLEGCGGGLKQVQFSWPDQVGPVEEWTWWWRCNVLEQLRHLLVQTGEIGVVYLGGHLD